METAELFSIIYSLPTYQIKTPFEPCCGFADNIQKNLQLCDRAGTSELQYYVIAANITTYYDILLRIINHITKKEAQYSSQDMDDDAMVDLVQGITHVHLVQTEV